MRDGARIEGEGSQKDEGGVGGGTGGESVKIDWMEAMFLATRGGTEALGLDCGVFKVGAPFDAQRSTSKSWIHPLLLFHFPSWLITVI